MLHQSNRKCLDGRCQPSPQLGNGLVLGSGLSPLLCPDNLLSSHSHSYLNGGNRRNLCVINAGNPCDSRTCTNSLLSCVPVWRGYLILKKILVRLVDVRTNKTTFRQWSISWSTIIIDRAPLTSLSGIRLL